VARIVCVSWDLKPGRLLALALAPLVLLLSLLALLLLLSSLLVWSSALTPMAVANSVQTVIVLIIDFMISYLSFWLMLFGSRSWRNRFGEAVGADFHRRPVG
jgi:hypothetical protein